MCEYEKSLEEVHADAISRLRTDNEAELLECTQRLLYRRIDSVWLLIAFFNTLELWLEENQEVSEFLLLFIPLSLEIGRTLL